MQIFLTGGTGFIGSHYLNNLLRNNHKVVALKRNDFSKTKIILEKEPLWIKSNIANINEKYLLKKDLLVHLAAHSTQPPYDNLENCIQKNVLNPLSLFEKAYSVGIRRFLVVGSCFEYGLSANSYDFIPPNAPLLPVDTYPTSKAIASLAFTQWAIQKKVSLSIQRIFYVYGEGENKNRFYPLIKKAAREGRDFEMSNGQQIRDISNVDLIALKIYEESKRIILSKNFDVRISNVGSGNNLSIKEFALDIWRKYSAKGKLKIGLLPYRDREIMRYVPDLNQINIIQNFE